VADKETVTTPSEQANLAKVLERLADRADYGPTPQVRTGRAKIKTPWNPTGALDRPSLSRSTFLNGHRLRETTLSDGEIAGLNQLKAGRYHNRKWLVVEADVDGRDESSVQVFIPNKTEADRLETKSVARNLQEILDLILAEQKTAKSA
jgi:hypothetical protein